MGCKESIPIRSEAHAMPGDDTDVNAESGEAQSLTSASPLPINLNNNGSSNCDDRQRTSEPQAEHDNEAAAQSCCSSSSEEGRRRRAVLPRACIKHRKELQQQQQESGGGTDTAVVCHFDPILPEVPEEHVDPPNTTSSTITSYKAAPTTVATTTSSGVTPSSTRPPPLKEPPPATDAAQAAQEYQQLVEHKRQAALEQRQQRSLEEFDPIRPLDSFNITHRGLLGRCWDRRHPELVPITLAYLAALNKSVDTNDETDLTHGEEADLMHIPSSPLTGNAAGITTEDTFGPPHHRHQDNLYCYYVPPAQSTAGAGSVSSQQSSPTMPNRSFASEACWCGVHRSSHWFTAAGMDFRNAAAIATTNSPQGRVGSPVQATNNKGAESPAARMMTSGTAEDASMARGSAHNALRGVDMGTSGWHHSPTFPRDDTANTLKSPLYPPADELARRTDAEREAIFNKAIVKELDFSGIKANFAFHVARGFSTTPDAKPLQRRNLRPAYGVRIRYWNHVSLVHPNLRTLARVAALTEHKSERIANELALTTSVNGSSSNGNGNASPPASLHMRSGGTHRTATHSERRGGIGCCSGASPVRLSGPNAAPDATGDSATYDNSYAAAGSPLTYNEMPGQLCGRPAEPGNLFWERLLRLQTIELDTDGAHNIRPIAMPSSSSAGGERLHYRYAQQAGSEENLNASFGQKMLVNDRTSLHRALGITTSTMKGTFFLTEKDEAMAGVSSSSASSSFPMDCILCYVMSLPLRRLLQLDGMPTTFLRQQLAQLCLSQKAQGSTSVCGATLNDLLRRLPRQAQYILGQSLTGPHALHNLHVEERKLLHDSFHSAPHDTTGSGSTANSSNSPSPPPHGLLEHYGSYHSSGSEPSGTAHSPNAPRNIVAGGARSGPTRIVAMEVCCFSAAIDPLRWRQHRYNRHPVEIDLSRPSARREYGEGIITEIMYGGTLVIECGCAAAADYLAEVLADMSWSTDNSLAGIVMDVKRRVKLRREKEERQRVAKASPPSPHATTREAMSKKNKAAATLVAGAEGAEEFRYRICQRIGGHAMRDTVEFKAISQLLLVGTVVEEHTISRPTREVTGGSATEKKKTSTPVAAPENTACSGEGVSCAAHISAAVGGSGGGTLGLGPSETPTFSRVASAWVDLRTIVVVMHTWGIHLLAHPEYAMPMAFYLQRYAGIAPALKSSTLSTLSFHDASIMEDETFADSEELELEFYAADAGLPPPPPRPRNATRTETHDATPTTSTTTTEQAPHKQESSNTTTTSSSGLPIAQTQATSLVDLHRDTSLQRQQGGMMASIASSSFIHSARGSAESLSYLGWASRVPTAPYIAHDDHGNEALVCDTEHEGIPNTATHKVDSGKANKMNVSVDTGHDISLPPSSPTSSSSTSSSTSSSSSLSLSLMARRELRRPQQELLGVRPELSAEPGTMPPPMTPLTRSTTSAMFNHVDSMISPCATMGTALPTPVTLPRPHPHHHHHRHSSHHSRHSKQNQQRRSRRQRRNSSPPLSTSAPTVPQTPALGLRTATPSPAENNARTCPISSDMNTCRMNVAAGQGGTNSERVQEGQRTPADTPNVSNATTPQSTAALSTSSQRPVSPMPSLALPTRAEQQQKITTKAPVERGVVSVPSSVALDVDHETHTGKNAGTAEDDMENDECLDPLQQHQQHSVRVSYTNSPLFSGKRWSTSGTSDTESIPTTLHTSLPGLAEDEERWRMTMLELRALQQELQEMSNARDEAEQRYHFLHTRLYILQRAFLPHGTATELELVFLYLTTALREPEELFGGCLYLSDADWLPMLVAVWTAPQCRVRVIEIATELTWRDLPKLGILAGLLYYRSSNTNTTAAEQAPSASLEQLRINAARLLGDQHVIGIMNGDGTTTNTANHTASSGDSEKEGKPRKAGAVKLLLTRKSSRHSKQHPHSRPHHNEENEDNDEYPVARTANGFTSSRGGGGGWGSGGDEGRGVASDRTFFALSHTSLLGSGGAAMMSGTTTGGAANHGFGVDCPPFIVTPEQARDTLWLLLCAAAANLTGSQFRLTLYDFPLDSEELHRYRKHLHDSDYELTRAHTFSLHRTLSSLFSRKKIAEAADEVTMRQDSLSLGSFVIFSPGSPVALNGSFSPLISTGAEGGTHLVNGSNNGANVTHAASPVMMSHTMKEASAHSIAGSSAAVAPTMHRVASFAGDSFVLPLDPTARQVAQRTQDKHGLLVHVHHTLMRDWLRPREVCVESRAFHTVLYHVKDDHPATSTSEEPHSFAHSLTVAQLTSSSSSLSAMRGTVHHSSHHTYINPFNAHHNHADYWLPPARQRKLQELAAEKAAHNAAGTTEPIAEEVHHSTKDVHKETEQQGRRVFGLATIAKEQQVLLSEEARLYGQANKIWHVLYKSVKQHNRDVAQAYSAENTNNNNTSTSAGLPSRLHIILEPY